jgi:hypothetical protein
MPLVMRAERTSWEKATAIHVFCKQGAFRGGDRIARHWQDVTRLDAAGCADRSLADEELAKAVADHMNSFFPKSAQMAHGSTTTQLSLVDWDHLQLCPQLGQRMILKAQRRKDLEHFCSKSLIHMVGVAGF